MRHVHRIAAAALLGSALSGCVTEAPDARFGDVQSLLQQRTGQHVVWRRDAAEDRQAQVAVRELLAGELTLEAAVQVALLDNPGQQAVYEELGIAQADLVQAGLLGNPVFSGHLRWPDSGPRGPNLELAVVQPFLDVFARPARRRMAQAQADAAVARVADAALALQADVGAAFVDYQAELQRHAQLQVVARAAELAAELARRQRQAGNVSELEAAVQLAACQQSQLDLLRGAAEVTEGRERFARLLGPSAQRTEWRVGAELPEPPPGEPPLAELQALALAQRLDLVAAHHELQAVRGQLDYASEGRLAGGDVGLSWEQDTDGQRVLGPTFEIALPFGGQRQADVLRLAAQERQAQRRLEDLQDQVRSDVRLAHARAQSARQLWQGYARDLLPLQARILALSQQQYDGMLLGPFALLQARQTEALTARQAAEALRDLWRARLELVRAVGGNLPDAGAPSAPMPAEAPSEVQPAEPADDHTHQHDSGHHHGDKP